MIRMDEYICREDVLKAFKLIAKNPNKDYQRGMQDTIDCLVPKVIADIPAADVQPVKNGRWIEQRHFPTDGYNYNVPYSTYVCSNCGLKIHNDEYAKYVRGIYTNCPICTARMDGDAE